LEHTAHAAGLQVHERGARGERGQLAGGRQRGVEAQLRGQRGRPAVEARERIFDEGRGQQAVHALVVGVLSRPLEVEDGDAPEGGEGVIRLVAPLGRNIYLELRFSVPLRLGNRVRDLPERHHVANGRGLHARQVEERRADLTERQVERGGFEGG